VNVLDELTEKNNLIETKNKELEKSLRLNEKILHLISHNFRAPLTNIQSLFLLYRDKDINSQEFNEFIPTLLKNTNNGLIILDNLLYWSGLEKSKDLTETCILSVVPTVEHQIKKIAAELDEKKITLVCKCNELVYVEFNSALFEIIIRNILLLCVTNSKSNTNIHVYIKPSTRNIEFEFIYKGYKLLTNDLEKIETFEIDFSEQNLIYSMGLFICKKYIDAAGGIFTIDYSATNENSIHILLPRFNMK
jgi:signal transduction histidine kinase